MLSVFRTITWLLKLSNDHRNNSFEPLVCNLKAPQIIMRMYSEIFAINYTVYIEISYFQPPAFLISAAQQKKPNHFYIQHEKNHAKLHLSYQLPELCLYRH